MGSQNAYEFFQQLESYLNGIIPCPDIMRDEITRTVTESKGNDDGHMRFPEGALLNKYITPNMHKFLTDREGLSKDEAHQALLSESFRNLPGVACASPARFKANPFQKAVGSNASDIMKAWRGEGGGSAVSRPAPDIALRHPYKVIFEGKYFRSGGRQAAESELVKDLYQAFFYLGLSKLPEADGRPAWDYEYSCLLAYDNSEDSTFLKAWSGLPREVKEAFWEGANIYVMILTGSH